MTSVNIDLLTINDERPWFENLDEEHTEFYEAMGYVCCCKIHGKAVGLSQFLYTVGICVGMDETGYEHRFCYEDAPEAFSAMLNWILSGNDAPAGFITRK